MKRTENVACSAREMARWLTRMKNQLDLRGASGTERNIRNVYTAGFHRSTSTGNINQSTPPNRRSGELCFFCPFCSFCDFHISPSQLHRGTIASDSSNVSNRTVYRHTINAATRDASTISSLAHIITGSWARGKAAALAAVSAFTKNRNQAHDAHLDRRRVYSRPGALRLSWPQP